MTGESTFASRLKAARLDLGIKQKEFASRLNISPPTLSEIEAGKYKPGFDFISNIARVFKVNLYFLLFGIGEPFLDPEELKTRVKPNYAASEKEVERFLWYFQRSPLVQFFLLGHFRSLLSSEKRAIEEEAGQFPQKS